MSIAQINDQEIAEFFSGSRVAVTGAAGTIGHGLLEHLARCGVEELVALDNHETDLFFLARRWQHDSRIRAFLCDVRQKNTLERFLDGVDYVFHAAALKHVPSCEMSPFEAVQTNIYGSQNVIEAAINCGVKKVLFTSTDKAVNPTNVMGTSKLMGERLFTSASAMCRKKDDSIFASSRFGNVIGSSGSVVPLFVSQIQKKMPITLTDRRMTRFVMSIDHAIQLVLKAMIKFDGGEVYVSKMPVLSVEDLAKVMRACLAPLFGHQPEELEIVETGIRPGEKLYEELTTEEEISRTYEMDEFLVVEPAFRNFNQSNAEQLNSRRAKTNSTYNSSNQPLMHEREIVDALTQPGVLPDDIRQRLIEREN